ncbi:MAG: energy-coupling factor transporter transmembrane protein EcfT, partial [Anaerobutyricum sp.]
SAAALTRGLGAPVRRTNVCEIGFHVQDFIAIVVCFACFILFFLHQYIVF